MPSVAYIDTSAFLKLILLEDESKACQAEIVRWTDLVSSELLKVETIRTLKKTDNDQLVSNATKLLESVNLIKITGTLLDRACDLDPPILRTLDAIHMASALELINEIDVIFTYDSRFISSADFYGFKVLSP